MGRAQSLARAPDAGVTLTEMLVVLAVISVASGAAMLRLGAAQGGADQAGAMDILRQNIAQRAERALFDGQDVLFEWRRSAYRLGQGADWMVLPDGLVFDTSGQQLLAADGASRPFVLTARGPAGVAQLGFDGLEARLTAVAAAP